MRHLPQQAGGWVPGGTSSGSDESRRESATKFPHGRLLTLGSITAARIAIAAKLPSPFATQARRCGVCSAQPVGRHWATVRVYVPSAACMRKNERHTEGTRRCVQPRKSVSAHRYSEVSELPHWRPHRGEVVM
jgi:hypothetical protein